MKILISRSRIFLNLSVCNRFRSLYVFVTCFSRSRIFLVCHIILLVNELVTCFSFPFIFPKIYSFPLILTFEGNVSSFVFQDPAYIYSFPLIFPKISNNLCSPLKNPNLIPRKYQVPSRVLPRLADLVCTS